MLNKFGRLSLFVAVLFVATAGVATVVLVRNRNTNTAVGSERRTRLAGLNLSPLPYCTVPAVSLTQSLGANSIVPPTISFDYTCAAGYIAAGSNDAVGTSTCLSSFQWGPAPECIHALMVLYRATGGARWTNKQNWGVGEPCSNQWFGVTCLNRVVTSLSLPRNQLNGTLPAALWQLTGLQSVDLSGNQLSGPIPLAQGQLPALTSLNLAINALTGGIPPALGSVSKLQELRLNSNQLSGSIPRELGQLLELKTLVLQLNVLSGPLPDSLAQLSKLSTLGLGYNSLSGVIPPWLGQLTQLQLLHLGNNQFSGSLPATLSQLGQLDTLFLDYLQLSGAWPAALQPLVERLKAGSAFYSGLFCVPSGWNTIIPRVGCQPGVDPAVFTIGRGLWDLSPLEAASAAGLTLSGKFGFGYTAVLFPNSANALSCNGQKTPFCQEVGPGYQFNLAQLAWVTATRVDGDPHAVVLEYTGGSSTLCYGPRGVQLKLSCDPNAATPILANVQEPVACTYLFDVRSQVLCNLPVPY